MPQLISISTRKHLGILTFLDHFDLLDKANQGQVELLLKYVRFEVS